MLSESRTLIPGRTTGFGVEPARRIAHAPIAPSVSSQQQGEIASDPALLWP